MQSKASLCCLLKLSLWQRLVWKKNIQLIVISQILCPVWSCWTKLSFVIGVGMQPSKLFFRRSLFKCYDKYAKNRSLIRQNAHKEHLCILGHFAAFLFRFAWHFSYQINSNTEMISGMCAISGISFLRLYSGGPVQSKSLKQDSL